MKIGILGASGVAQALAVGFVKHGHQVMLGTRAAEKLAAWGATHPEVKIGTGAQAAAFGEALVLAVKGTAAAAALEAAGPANLKGKTVMDATNPIADAPPVNGVLNYFTGPNESLLERLQQLFPDARFVKVFSSVGAAFMVNPDLPGGPPTMFICGNEESAKALVARVLVQFGWEAADMGKAEAARAIEPLAMLWCIPGFLRNDWSHAFKMLKN